MGHATRTIDTPIGRYMLAANETGLTHVKHQGAASLPQPDADTARAPEALRHLDAAERALHEYFAGRRRDFEDLALTTAGTPFQEEVWKALRSIPFGRTASYGEVARRLGREGAARAVGLANHDNPLGIVVPCHRVIGARGELTGYAGGLERKRWLLRHEGALLV